MKATQVAAPGELSVVDCPEPELVDDHVRLAPITATLSGRNVRHVYDSPAEAYPLGAGSSAHELVGKVIDARYTARQWRAFEADEIVMAYVAEPLGLAETVVVPNGQLYWLPPTENPDLQIVPAARQLGQIIEACNSFPPLVTGSVAVVGQGGTGLLFDQMLQRMGAASIVAVDLLAGRRDAASRFGATLALDGARPPFELADEVRAANGGALVDVVIETAGNPEALSIATELVAPEGLLHVYGAPNTNLMQFDVGGLAARRYTVRASGAGFGGVNPFWSSYGNAMNLVLRNEVEIKSLISHRFSLERASEAFALARSGDDGALKVAIDF